MSEQPLTQALSTWVTLGDSLDMSGHRGDQSRPERQPDVRAPIPVP
jgi:hypothetical protein